VKDLERIHNCRLLLRGLLYLIGRALGVFIRENAFKVKEEMSEEVPAILKSTI
jgi:hypothetical protein